MSRDLVSQAMAELIMENTALFRMVNEIFEEGVKLGAKLDGEVTHREIRELWDKSESRRAVNKIKQRK